MRGSSTFRYEEYPDRWRELWDIFSREAVWSGAFDQYAASKRKRGTSEVDAEFLKEIEGWRDVLARNIALRNEGLSSEDLNAAVQSTIDRVVFLRMAEDRRLEPCEQLLKLCERDDIYARFMHNLCRKADEKYNSGLFHFQKEHDTDEEPDRVTPSWRSMTRFSSRSCKACTSPTVRPITSASCPSKSWAPSTSDSWAR